MRALTLFCTVFSIFLLSSIDSTYAANDPCATALVDSTGPQDPVGLRKLERRLNHAYRSHYSLIDRVNLRLFKNLRLFSPFVVHEQSDLFPNGELPAAGIRHEIIIVRKTRAEGIAELRHATTLSEERAWIYLPALGLWFYDSLHAVGANSVSHNGLIGPLLLKEFGELETFHTHPVLAGQEQYDRHIAIFKRYGVSFERSQLFLAIPSDVDFEALWSGYGDLEAVEFPLDKVKSYVVSPFGVTSYQLQPFTYVGLHGGESPVLPSFAVATREDVPLLKIPLPNNEIIEEILKRASARSTDAVDCMVDLCHWDDETAPKLIFEFEPFEP